MSEAEDRFLQNTDDGAFIYVSNPELYKRICGYMGSYAREYHAKEMERKLGKTPLKDFYTLAEWLHNNYEEIALNNGWKTQSDCQVPFDELPNENKETMLELTLRLLTHLKEQKQ